MVQWVGVLDGLCIDFVCRFSQKKPDSLKWTLERNHLHHSYLY